MISTITPMVTTGFLAIQYRQETDLHRLPRWRWRRSTTCALLAAFKHAYEYKDTGKTDEDVDDARWHSTDAKHRRNEVEIKRSDESPVNGTDSSQHFAHRAELCTTLTHRNVEKEVNRT